MERPLIAVSAAIEVLGTAFGDRDCTKLGADYTNAVYAAGGQPVIMPVSQTPAPGMLSRMDGLLLTGGGDLDPSLYGEEPDEAVYGIRKDRDAFETALYQEAIALGMPILAICRGLQLVNVLRGGTLLQQIEDEQSHWQENPPTNMSHAITVASGSSLAAMFGDAGEVKVNSYHHQAVKDLGAGLQVTAVCGDVIEAVEAADADLVGVQWHPENLASTNDQHAGLFTQFVQRAAEFRTTV
ncbi:gamma-glutamyl-gamma-aminobutyrate hydrolase family protein [Saccharopolyspora pogona]|uniref:gamma-glutamyl-gamma-aminobutyrate hydrolase family protein n=1 Tax=Saccharopolyspora pogona TaxID=333966 RepID=UPI001CC24E0E|nr:gamma-glutamyl-gamma-aminobutyrate hydrolase family protein [Saccharopolyspora pogona]